MRQFEIEVYKTHQGKLPFNEWLTNLSDVQARQKIRTRLDRLALGNFDDFEPVDESVFELKIDFGPGYRLLCQDRQNYNLASLRR